MKFPRINNGFTLLELMIVISIVSILAAVAIPSYMTYTRRSYYKEVVMAAEPFKIGVGICYQKLNTLTGCSGGNNDVPANITVAGGAVQSVTTVDGVIQVTPVEIRGILASDTYILTPQIDGSTIVWTPSGGGVVNGYTD